MADQQQSQEVSEEEAREVAESSRQKTEGRSFLREVFLGNFHMDWVTPYPDPNLDRPAFVEFYSKLEQLLDEEVDSDEIDRSGEYPPELVDALMDLGAFGMKIPEEYGGL